jgi:hypothetical protein
MLELDCLAPEARLSIHMQERGYSHRAAALLAVGGLFGHAFSQGSSHLCDATKYLASVDSRRMQPSSQLLHQPRGNGNRTNMAGLTCQIDNWPVFFPLFQMLDFKANGFVSPQPGSQKECKERAISLAF